jgi:hypothetical protein
MPFLLLKPSRRDERQGDLSDLRQRLERFLRVDLHLEGKLADRILRLEEAAASEALLFQALFRICLEKKLVKESEFLFVLRKLDLVDGVADGQWRRRRTPPPAEGEGGSGRKP